MMPVVDRLGPWLLDVGILAAAWLAMVMIAMVACRQPARRRLIARAGLLGSLGLGPLSLVPADRIAPEAWLWVPIGTDFSRESFPADELRRGATIAYLVILAAGVGGLLFGAWATGRLLRSSRRPSYRVRRLYAELPFEGTRRRRPELRVSDRIGRPALLGGFRPTILIPESWDRIGPGSGDHLRLALAHELAHAERRDPLFQWIAAIVQVIWFPIPPAWWIRQQLAIDQEVLADDRAARRLGAAGPSYAASLVELAAGLSPRPERPDAPPNALPSAALAPKRSRLLLRVAMLVGCPFPIEPDAPRWWRFGLISVMLALLLVVGRTSPSRMLERPRPSPDDRAQRPFHLLELELHPDAEGRPLRLPASLAQSFELSALVSTDPDALPRTAIAGYRLGGPGASATPPRPHEAAWRRIRLVVEDGSGRLWIDGLPATAIPEPDGAGDRLTIRAAPDHPATIRDLVLPPIGPARSSAPGDAGATRSALPG